MKSMQSKVVCHMVRFHLFMTMPPALLAAAVMALAGSARAVDGSAGEAGAFVCLIQPRMVLKISTPTPGVISEMLVDRGDRVTRGDVIGRIEAGVETAAVALAKARAESDTAVRSSKVKLEYQLRKEERAKTLRRNDNIALSAADEAETAARVAETDHDEALINHKLAQLELARAVEVLKQRTIRSPVDGVVTARVLGPGEYAFDQAHLVTVSQIDPLNVEVFVPLAQYGRINVGDAATVMPEAPVGGAHKARVSVVDRVFDAASGTIGVRLELPNPGNRLPAGLKCQVRFE